MALSALRGSLASSMGTLTTFGRNVAALRKVALRQASVAFRNSRPSASLAQ